MTKQSLVTSYLLVQSIANQSGVPFYGMAPMNLVAFVINDHNCYVIGLG